MATIEIVEMMRTLRTERSHTRKELKNLDKVISALRELSANSTPPRNRPREARFCDQVATTPSRRSTLAQAVCCVHTWATGGTDSSLCLTRSASLQDWQNSEGHADSKLMRRIAVMTS